MRFLNLGNLYAGSSMINGGVSPCSVVCLIKSTHSIAVQIPKRYIPYVITSALLTPKNDTIPPAIAVSMGSFAPHEKKGITLIVAVLSLSSASVRVFIIAGSEQPKPIIMGIKALPESPNLLKILSKTKAIRAM